LLPQASNFSDRAVIRLPKAFLLSIFVESELKDALIPALVCPGDKTEFDIYIVRYDPVTHEKRQNESKFERKFKKRRGTNTIVATLEARKIEAALSGTDLVVFRATSRELYDDGRPFIFNVRFVF
jgi:hypothetical protein